MWKTIFFDLDGTITDSGEGIMKCAAYALEKGFGITVPDEALKAFVGPPLADSFMAQGLDSTQAAEAVRLYRERYWPIGIHENRPYEGIADMLGRLKQEGMRLAVVSSKPVDMCRQVLKNFDLERYFSLVVGSNLDGTMTDKAMLIGRTLGILGLENEKESAVMVGDRKYDAEGAAKAGIECVAVSYGYGERSELEECAPACIVDNVRELTNVLIWQYREGNGAAIGGTAAAGQGGSFGGQGSFGGRGGFEGQASREALAPGQGGGNVQNAQYEAARQEAAAPSGIWDYGYRKERDESPFKAVIYAVWPTVAACVLVAIITSFTLGILLGLVYGVSGRLSSLKALEIIYRYEYFITSVAYMFALLLLVPLFLGDEKKRRARGYTDRCLIKHPRLAALLIACFVCGMFIAFAVNMLISVTRISSLDPSTYEIFEYVNELSSPVWEVFALVVAAPLCEEIMFRGLLFRRLRDVLNVPLAIVISALAFGIYHGNLVQFVYATILGAFFAAFYEHCGSIIASILMHSGANAFSALYNMVVSKWDVPGIAYVLGAVVCAVLFAAACLVIFRKGRKVNRI